MKRMNWLDDKREEIIELYNKGLKQTEIAQRFNTSQTAISTRLRKWGVSNPDGNRFKRIEISEEVLYDLYWNQEKHPVEIAEMFGLTKMAIHQKMDAYGIKKRTKSQARFGKLNPIYGVGHSDEARIKMSEAFVSGRKIHTGSWGVGSYYETPNQGKKWMRSGWEVKVGDYLTKQGIDWYYEYKWLFIEDGINYLPDFYLPQCECFIEVKGIQKQEDMEKLSKAMELYMILLWDGEELLRRGIINNCGNTALNRKYNYGRLVEF